jgi:hypothetical protein
MDIGRTGSLKFFKNLFLGYCIGIAPMMLIFSILTLIGIVPFNFNGMHYYGFPACLGEIVLIPFVGTPLAKGSWMFLTFGFWLLGKVRPIFGRNKN